jgi:hypothetical protein
MAIAAARIHRALVDFTTGPTEVYDYCHFISFFPLMVVDVVLTHERVTDAKPRRLNGLIARQLYRVGWKWQYTQPSSRLGHRRRVIVTPATASSSRYTRNQTDWDPMATQNAGCRGGSEATGTCRLAAIAMYLSLPTDELVSDRHSYNTAKYNLLGS